jgi:predicted aldo/keto reductase-like oxidoreductase
MPKQINALQMRRSSTQSLAGNKEQGSNYAETTLIEDVIEANKMVGEHIDSLTRRSTLIQEQLAVLHPEVNIRTIRRILSKDIEK